MQLPTDSLSLSSRSRSQLIIPDSSSSDWLRLWEGHNHLLFKTVHNFATSGNITHFPFYFLIISVLSESEYCTLKALFWKPVFSMICSLLSHSFLVILGYIICGQQLLTWQLCMAKPPPWAFPPPQIS